LTSSSDQDSPAIVPFGVHSTTKLERSSEKVRPTMTKVAVTQPKYRSLDMAAVKQAQLAVDTEDVGKGDRQSLKLIVDRVSNF